MGLSDSELEQISKTLERGGKMLAQHCATCKSPLFKVQDQIVCPVCEYRQVEGSEALQEGDTAKPTLTKAKTKPGGVHKVPPLERMVTDVILAVAAEMESETDLARVQLRLDCIEQGLKIVKMIRESGFSF